MIALPPKGYNSPVKLCKRDTVGPNRDSATLDRPGHAIAQAQQKIDLTWR